MKITKEYKIRQGPLNYNSKHTVYLIQCKVGGKQNCGSRRRTRRRINNYKTKFRNYRDKFLTGTLVKCQIIQQARRDIMVSQTGHFRSLTMLKMKQACAEENLPGKIS